MARVLPAMKFFLRDLIVVNLIANMLMCNMVYTDGEAGTSLLPQSPSSRMSHLYRLPSPLAGLSSPSALCNWAAGPLAKPISHIAGQSVVPSASARTTCPSSISAANVGEDFWSGGSCVYSFGAGDFGQLAIGFSESSKVPMMVEGTSTYIDENGTAVVGPPIVQCSAGGYHTLMLDLEGSAYACGDNSNGQLGVGAFHESVEGKSGRSRRRSESRPTLIVHDSDGGLLPAM